MQDSVHGYTRGYGWKPTPRKPFFVIERTPPFGLGRRTDTQTSSLAYAMRRRDELRRTRRPAFVQDIDGRRVEVERWL